MLGDDRDRTSLYAEDRQRQWRWKCFEVDADGHPLILVGTSEDPSPDHRRFNIIAYDITRHAFESEPPLMKSLAMPHGFERVKITDGYVVLDCPRLQGLGLGTLIFNEGVAWAKVNFPDYEVAPISLDRPNRQKFEQLTRFYGRFGLSWDQPPADWEWGVKSLLSRPVRARELRTYPLEALPLIRQINVPKLIARGMEAAETAREVDTRLSLLMSDRFTIRWRLITIGNRINFVGWLVAIGGGVFIGRLWSEGMGFVRALWP